MRSVETAYNVEAETIEARAWFGVGKGELPSLKELETRENLVRQCSFGHSERITETGAHAAEKEISKLRHFYSILNAEAILPPLVLLPFQFLISKDFLPCLKTLQQCDVSLSKVREYPLYVQPRLKIYANKIMSDALVIEDFYRRLQNIECMPGRQTQETQKDLLALYLNLKSFQESLDIQYKDFIFSVLNCKSDVKSFLSDYLQEVLEAFRAVEYLLQVLETTHVVTAASDVPADVQKEIQAHIKQRELEVQKVLDVVEPVYVSFWKKYREATDEDVKQQLIQEYLSDLEKAEFFIEKSPVLVLQHSLPKLQQSQEAVMTSSVSQQVMQVQITPAPFVAQQDAGQSLENSVIQSQHPLTEQTTPPQPENSVQQAPQLQSASPCEQDIFIKEGVTKDTLEKVILAIHDQRRHAQSWFTKILSLIGLNLRQTKEDFSEKFTDFLGKRKDSKTSKAISKEDLRHYLERFKEVNQYLEQKRPGRNKSEKMLQDAMKYVLDGENKLDLLTGFKSTPEKLTDLRSRHGFKKEEGRHEKILQQFGLKK